MDRINVSPEAEKIRFLWSVDPKIIIGKYGALIHQQVRVWHAKLMAAGVVIEYQDVYQEGLIALHKAVAKFQPYKEPKKGALPPKTQQGFAFTTYLHRALYFEIKRWALVLIEERRGLNSEKGDKILKHRLVNIGDLGEEGQDLLEAIPSSSLSPEEILERKQERQFRLNNLTSTARKAVELYLHPTPELCAKYHVSECEGAIPFTAICGELHLSPTQASKIRREIFEKSDLSS